MLLNKSAKDIRSEYRKTLLKDAKTKKANGIYSQYFIYYSGHGRMNNNSTMGIDLENNDIEIEEFVYSIASRRNCTVLAILDCCRNKMISKGIDEEIKEESPNFNGRYAIVYTC